MCSLKKMESFLLHSTLGNFDRNWVIFFSIQIMFVSVYPIYFKFSTTTDILVVLVLFVLFFQFSVFLAGK